MSSRRIRVAWISDFPIEWIGDLPGELKHLPRKHAATWLRVLFDEFKLDPQIDLHIVALRKDLTANCAFEREGVTFHVLKVPPGLRGPTLFWIDTFLIGRVLNEVRPDVVHAWGTERGAALVAHRLKYPNVVTVQGLLMWYAETVPVNLYFRFASLLERMSLPRAPLVTTESKFAVQYLKAKMPNVRVLQAEHAPNWVFHRVQRRPCTEKLRFIYVGTLDYRKGGDLLVQALDRLRAELDWELQIIGGVEPTLLRKLRATTAEETWKRIQFKDNLSPPEIADELGQATMMLFPTRADTSPNAVKEAVVAGVPVVASTIGGIPDYVFPDENGLLFPSENLDAFVDAIRSACRHPLFGRGQVAAGSLNKTRDYLSPKRMAQRFMEAYQRVLKTE